jgi:serine/threonine protein kinase
MQPETQAVGRELSAQPSPLAPGAVLQSRYRIVKQLGKGGMGAVYEAVDQRLDATVALKETFSVDDRLRRQFEQEARLLAQLNHPALPRVSDYFTEEQRAFLVMQFIEGVDLAEIIAKQPGPFPRNQVVAWADQLLDALIFLHSRERQIIHRDIKPHNLKLTQNGTIALLDFGLAKTQAEDRSANDSSICGYTRRYAPLEQIQDQGTTPQSDIYALGATLYHLLTGVKPTDAVIREAALVNSMPDPHRPANEVHAAVGPELALILCRAMAQNPSDRYGSAKEFREALAQLGRSRDQVSDEATAVHEEKTVARPERTRSTDAFESYSILKPEEPAMFSPQSGNRSNLVVMGILFLILSGLIAAMYGYNHWNDSATASTTRVNLQQATISSPSPDKLKLNSTIAPLNPTPAVESTANVGKISAETPAKIQTPFRFDNAKPNSAVVSVVSSPAKANIPSMRLPGTDLKDNDPAPSVSHLPAFGQREAVTERQVLRTPDGIQVVKFSDGSTRVFRPGEKNPVSGGSPQ